MKTVPQLAAKYGCHRCTFYHAILRGDIHAEWTGTSYLIDESLPEFQAYIKRHEPFKDMEGYGELISPLTERELAVLGLLDWGVSNQQIATALQVEVATVGFHLGNIYRKIGARNRRGAILYKEALEVKGS